MGCNQTQSQAIGAHWGLASELASSTAFALGGINVSKCAHTNNTPPPVTGDGIPVEKYKRYLVEDASESIICLNLPGKLCANSGENHAHVTAPTEFQRR